MWRFRSTYYERIIEAMAIDISKLSTAVADSVTATERALAASAAKDATIADLQAQLAAAGTSAADQAAVDAQADILAAETAKVPA